MGSFAGHIDEGIFFVCLALWWIYKIFPDYIAAIQLRKKGQFRAQLSYRANCCCSVPVETILKISFPTCGFLAEVLNGGANFFDEDGNFTKLVNMQHMTIYGIFVIHSLIDLAMTFGAPLPAGLDYGTISLAFSWYGMSFYFHAGMPGKPPMEGIIHLLPITVMLAMAVAFLLELRSRGRSILVATFRIYGLLVLGTWFIHVSFILYLPSPFPGNLPNPAWDGDDHRNVHFIVALFGFHLCFHVVSVLLAYLLCYWMVRKRIAGTASCRDECHTLLEGEGSDLDVEDSAT